MYVILLKRRKSKLTIKGDNIFSNGLIVTSLGLYLDCQLHTVK